MVNRGVVDCSGVNRVGLITEVDMRKSLDIQRGDYVKAIVGHFKAKRGWVARVDGSWACVVWRGVWDHGIWVSLSDLKRTKRLKPKGDRYDLQ